MSLYREHELEKNSSLEESLNTFMKKRLKGFKEE